MAALKATEAAVAGHKPHLINGGTATFQLIGTLPKTASQPQESGEQARPLW